MKALVVKEIRLLLPAYVLALLLAIIPVWLLASHPNGSFQFLAAALAAFGALILALSSFGREFGMGTFSLLLAQPLPRGKIWWTKFTVLSCALGTVCGAYFLSGVFYTNSDPIFLTQGREVTAKLSLVSLVILASGIWAALLLRQMLAAFWIALLVPAGILMMNYLMQGTEFTAYAALGLYSILAVAWAWIYFLRAQEVAWTGSAITLPGWQSLGIGARADHRARRPIAALLWKEFQLYQVALMGMAGFFLLHLGIVALRKAIPASNENFLLRGVLEQFGAIWLIVPLLIASLSVAEERRLGTLQGQLCQPVSSRAQFIIKLLFALVLSGGLSALLLWTAERIGGAIGAGPGVGGIQGLPTLSVIFMAIAFLTFYASTLTRNFLQAMAAAVGVGIVLSLVWEFAGKVPEIAGVQLWGKPLLGVISWPAMLVALVWLAHGNFRRLSETRRLWFRNARGVLCVMAGSAALAAAVYNRIWEFIPLEPAHGPARLSASRPPVINPDFSGDVTVLAPDGGLRQDFIYYDYGKSFPLFGNEIPWVTWGGNWKLLPAGQRISGSNWVSVAGNHHENVAVQSDGTLWVSEKPTPEFVRRGNRAFLEPRAKMVKLGDGADWKKVVPGPDHSSMILLKTDGTLWRWPAGWKDGSSAKSKEYMPLLRTAAEPHRLNAEPDWGQLLATGYWTIAWEKNGRAWKFFAPYKLPRNSQVLVDPELAIERCENLDNAKWRSLAATMNAGVRDDGTMWLLDGLHKSFRQVGTAADWVSVASGNEMLVAARRDGTLWKWTDVNWDHSDHPGWKLDQPPTRLGTRKDWVTTGTLSNGVVSLAADGSLWYWWRSDYSYNYNNPTWLAPTRKPEKIENLFDQP